MEQVEGKGGQCHEWQGVKLEKIELEGRRRYRGGRYEGKKVGEMAKRERGTEVRNTGAGDGKTDHNRRRKLALDE